MVQILVFGDSITYGAWDAEGGWVQRLRKYLDKIVIESNYKKYYLIYNLGISGDTSNGIIKRFKKEVIDRLDDKEKTLFLFSVGTNDCLIINKNNKFNISSKKYEKNLNKLIELANNYSKDIVLIGLTPVDDTKLNPLPWAPEYSAQNKHIKIFNSIVEKVASKNKILFIPLYENLVNLDYKSLLVDGDHPNTKGHEIIYKIIQEALLKNGLI